MAITEIFISLSKWIYRKFQAWYEKESAIEKQINEILGIKSEIEKILDNLRNRKGKILKTKVYLSQCYFNTDTNFKLIGSEKVKHISSCYKQIHEVSKLCEEYNCDFDKLDEICRNNGYHSVQNIADSWSPEKMSADRINNQFRPLQRKTEELQDKLEQSLQIIKENLLAIRK